MLANGSMSSNNSGEGDIRRNIIEADLVDCIVALPGQLFRSTQIPACLWFLSRGRANGEHRDRRGETLFIDARKLGHMVDRRNRDLSTDDLSRVADTYHAWRGAEGAADYADIPGFCKSAPPDEIKQHGFVLTPGRYVGAAPQEDDGEPFRRQDGSAFHSMAGAAGGGTAAGWSHRCESGAAGLLRRRLRQGT